MNRLPVMDETHLAAVLAAKGHKLTQPRRAVLKVIAAAEASLTPADIHARAQKYYRQTGLVTVYRTLELLVACGVVRKIHAADGCHAYAPASARHERSTSFQPAHGSTSVSKTIERYYSKNSVNRI